MESRLSGCCELCPQVSLLSFQVNRGKPPGLPLWSGSWLWNLNSCFKLSIYLRLWQEDVFILGRDTFSVDLRPKFSQIDVNHSSPFPNTVTLWVEALIFSWLVQAVGPILPPSALNFLRQSCPATASSPSGVPCSPSSKVLNLASVVIFRIWPLPHQLQSWPPCPAKPSNGKCLCHYNAFFKDLETSLGLKFLSFMSTSGCDLKTQLKQHLCQEASLGPSRRGLDIPATAPHVRANTAMGSCWIHCCF